MRRQIIILSMFCLFIGMFSGYVDAQERPMPQLKDPRYLQDKTVGVTQVHYEGEAVGGHYFTPLELADEVASHGIRALKIWINGDPFGEGMDEFWTHPGISTYVVRFTHPHWTLYYQNTDFSPVFTNYPTYQIASTLLRKYGHLNKTIIFTDWELDSAFYVTGFSFGNSWRYAALSSDRRQEGVEKARATRPGARMRVLHAVVVNRFNDGQFNFIKDVFPLLVFKPDMIGISFWHPSKDVTTAIEYVKNHTGYRATRIYIDEIGGDQDQQYDRLMRQIPLAREAGVRLVMVWNWRQTWFDTGDADFINNGMFFQDPPHGYPMTWGGPTGGYYAIRELNGGR